MFICSIKDGLSIAKTASFEDLILVTLCNKKQVGGGKGSYELMAFLSGIEVNINQVLFNKL
ncbi:hypothetical protein EBI01_13230 [Marinomonas rhizomae]|nr:hypothetical protein EBI01_13230 [Marinomonas rhizomae]